MQVDSVQYQNIPGLASAWSLYQRFPRILGRYLCNIGPRSTSTAWGGGRLCSLVYTPIRPQPAQVALDLPDVRVRIKTILNTLWDTALEQFLYEQPRLPPPLQVPPTSHIHMYRYTSSIPILQNRQQRAEIAKSNYNAPAPPAKSRLGCKRIWKVGSVVIGI